MGRTTFLLAILGLVLLAGCGGPARSPTPVTPAPVPGDTPTTTPEASNTTSQIVELVADPTALSAAHQEHLNGTSYTVQKTLLIEYPNGSRIREITTRTRVAPNRDRYVVERTIASSQASKRTAVWATGERLYRALDYGDTMAYIVIPPDAYATRDTEVIQPRQPGDRVKDVFEAFNARVTDPLARNVPSQLGAQNAVTIYWVEGTSLEHPEQVDTPGDPGPRDGRLRAIVSSNGVVHQYHVVYTTTVDGKPVRVTETVRFTDIGTTTVKRPAWYDPGSPRPRTEQRGALP